MRVRVLQKGFILFLLGLFSAAFINAKSSADVRLDTEEADAVLAILNKKKKSQPIIDSDWQRLFSSEGYIRLKKREAAFGRSFEDQTFKDFVLSDELFKRAELLSETLERWKKADTNSAAQKALAYLPKDARIKAKIYPMIKPRENSFVFETNTDPAIFLYLDPKVTKEQFENTLAHEFHHIGYASSCSAEKAKAESEQLPANKEQLLTWISAFGEGMAMLAAAGGPDVHPHTFSDVKDRERWDRDVANFNSDIRAVEKFFMDILDKRLTAKDEIQKAGFAFFGVQGAWYTVGWKMSVLIEKTYGREKLIECVCDKRKLLTTYNDAAKLHNKKSKEQLALWSDALIKPLD